MPFKKGQSGNPNGSTSADRQAIVKIRKGIDLAIDKMKHGNIVGIVAFQEKLALSFETDFLSTLKAVAPFLPKDMLIETKTYNNADDISDNDLAEIIAQRARQRHIEGEYEEITDDYKPLTATISKK